MFEMDYEEYFSNSDNISELAKMYVNQANYSIEKKAEHEIAILNKFLQNISTSIHLSK